MSAASLRHAELAQAEDGTRPVEEPHDALLAPDRGDGGHADVDLFAVDLRAQLAVLRSAALDDVHSGHDLDPADQADAHGGGECQDLFERTVDPVADPDPQLGRFDVDVGCPVAHGLGEDAADDLHDRRIVLDHVGRDVAVSSGPPPGGLDGLEGLDEVVEAADGPVVVLDGAADLGNGASMGRIAATRLAEQGEEFGRRLVGHRHVEADLVERHRDHEVLASDGVRDEIRGPLVRGRSVRGPQRPSRRARLGP